MIDPIPRKILDLLGSADFELKYKDTLCYMWTNIKSHLAELAESLGCKACPQTDKKGSIINNNVFDIVYIIKFKNN